MLLAAAVAKEFAGRGPGALSLLEIQFAIHDNRAISLSLLNAPPFAAREVIDYVANPVGCDL